MVDLTRDADGRVHARLLDLVPGRSKKAYADWLNERGEDFRQNVQVAALGPFGGYKSAIDEQLEDATAVLDAFHVVKLGTAVVDEVRRRVQQATTGHRGRKGDPLLGIQTILRAGAEHLTDKQQARLTRDPDVLSRLATVSNPAVLRNVLLNPRLTEPLVVRIAARRPARPEPLVEIWKTPRWSVRHAVRRALVFNPYLPPEVGAKIVPLLNASDLRELVADTGLLPALRQQAARLLLAPAPGSPPGPLVLPGGEEV